MSSFDGLVTGGMRAAMPQDVEHPALTLLLFSQVGRKFGKGRKRKYVAPHLALKLSGQLINATQPMAIPAGVAELFAYRLAQSCGVRVAPVEARTDEPTPDDFARCFIKQVPGGWILSERVPQAMPVYYLRGLVKTSVHDESTERLFHTAFAYLFDKRCPVSREAYDFPQAVPKAALDAARWDSAGRLLGHAFRALLYCSHAHTSNVLVDTAGSLTLIDHEKMIYREDTGDIRQLEEIAAGSSQARVACASVAHLTPDDIESALAAIPEPFWGAQNEAAALDYFAGRLAAWRKAFKPEVMHAGQ